jgi:alkane 1-monooxygenase
MTDLVRFSSLVFFYYPLSYVALLLSGAWPWLAIALMVATQVVVDNLTTPDLAPVAARRPILLDLLLYAHLPAGALMLLLMLWQAAPGDLFNIGTLAAAVLGERVLEAHAQASWLDLIAAGLLGGFIMSSNTVAGHELVHRLSNRVAVTAGRWLLAMNADAQFSISHVFGHHANIGTDKDPATARRGESLYRFVVRSAIGQYREAVGLERERLRRRGHGFLTVHNQLFSGVAMSAAVAAVCYAFAGWRGMAVYAIAAVYAKFLFETVNYIQHYGLVRMPGARVEPRHSWDCAARACSNAFYMLSRHSEHHARPALPFWRLQPTNLGGAGPQLRYGYLATMIFAMIPPLWFRLTTPLLLHWDRAVATEDEARMATVANRRSGIPVLAQAAQS